jgi:hypothetical protein
MGLLVAVADRFDKSTYEGEQTSENQTRFYKRPASDLYR